MMRVASRGDQHFPIELMLTSIDERFDWCAILGLLETNDPAGGADVHVHCIVNHSESDLWLMITAFGLLRTRFLS